MHHGILKIYLKSHPKAVDLQQKYQKIRHGFLLIVLKHQACRCRASRIIGNTVQNS